MQDHVICVYVSHRWHGKIFPFEPTFVCVCLNAIGQRVSCSNMASFLFFRNYPALSKWAIIFFLLCRIFHIIWQSCLCLQLLGNFFWGSFWVRTVFLCDSSRNNCLLSAYTQLLSDSNGGKAWIVLIRIYGSNCDQLPFSLWFSQLWENKDEFQIVQLHKLDWIIRWYSLLK